MGKPRRVRDCKDTECLTSNYRLSSIKITIGLYDLTIKSDTP